MVHKFSLFDTNIVVDVNSGTVHVFDEVAFEVLDYYGKYDKDAIVDMLGEKYGKDSVKEAIDEIELLEGNGQLFAEDQFGAILPLWKKNEGIKALCIHVAHDCNLRCGYCFASTGHFGKGRSLMDEETGRKAIDFLLKMSGKRKNLEVDFFGGEPLLNFGVVREIVEYARSIEGKYAKNFKFTLTTNAFDLNDEQIAFINKNMGNLVMSIDGRKAVNDQMRRKIDGSGTYDEIMPVIKYMAESRGQENYYVRGTYTRKNLDFSNDVLHLADEGFKQISVEPVVCQKGTGFDIRDEDIPVIFSEYEKLACEYVKRKKEGRGFNFFHFLIDLNQGPCVAKRLTGCGAGHEYVAVTPEGDIYPCHQFVGIDEFKMGNLNDDNLDTKIQDMFLESNIYTKQECAQCWAKFYCSGGCLASNFHFNADINKPYKIGCELMKKRLECALWVKTKTLA